MFEMSRVNKRIGLKASDRAMSRARIIQGVWKRHVPWKRKGVWRTDIRKSVLADPRLKVAEFHLEDGPVVRVPKSELQRVLIGGSYRYEGEIWGPFNIDPQASTVAEQKVEMDIYS